MDMVKKPIVSRDSTFSPIIQHLRKIDHRDPELASYFEKGFSHRTQRSQWADILVKRLDKRQACIVVKP